MTHTFDQQARCPVDLHFLWQLGFGGILQGRFAIKNVRFPVSWSTNNIAGASMLD